MIRLSEVDRRRLEAGELTGPEEALHASGEPADPAREPGPGSGEEERLLRDRPPHWDQP